MLLEKIEAEFPGVMEAYLAHKGRLGVLVLGEDLIIRECNTGFLQLLHLSESPVGRNLANFLTREGKEAFSTCPAGEDQRVILSFFSAGFATVALNCRLFCRTDGYVVFAEQSLDTAEDTLQQMTTLNNELVNLTRELTRQKEELQKAHARIKILGGLLPICSSCKKIRDDAGYWQHVEEYIWQHSEAQFSHGICPACMERLYPDLYEEMQQSEDTDGS